MNVVTDRIFILWVLFFFTNLILISIYRVLPFNDQILLLPNQFSGAILCLLNVFSPPLMTVIMFYLALGGKSDTENKRTKALELGIISLSAVVNLFFIAYTCVPMVLELPSGQDLISRYNEAALMCGVFNIVVTGPIISISYSR